MAKPSALNPELAAKVKMAGTDFFVAVPSGADVYLLSRVLHDWPDEQARVILRNCRAAMGAEARLCVLEQLAPLASELSREEQVDLAVKDLNMLVLVGGMERTLLDYRMLLERAGCSVDEVHHGAAADILVARPASGT